MRLPLTALLFSGLLAACAACAACAAEPDWSVRVTPFDQVYPALELSQARRDGAAPAGRREFAFGEGSGLVAVRVRSRHAGERVSLTVDAPGLDAPARVEGVMRVPGRDYELRPPLAWNPAQLRGTDVPSRVELRFTLQRDDAPADARMLSVSLRPLSEALYYVRDGHDTVDLSWIFAAYVDEGDAVVDAVLDSAIKSGIVETFDGYAAGSTDDVYRQVWAVWQALAAHGIRYSAADPGIARGPRVFSQRVRLLEQSWSDRAATCIDGSVLIASALQHIGLRPFLVLVPGHAFVGFHLDAAGDRAAYLETTVLGATPPPLPTLPAFASDFTPDAAARLDIARFSAALTLGRRRYNQAATRFDARHRPDYALIDIGAARAFGIEPIEAIRSKE
ncbi:MAG TPA: hypothetical protein VLC97_00125 [Rhodanobacteraceae bacterium]|nr:hypothetical protein [Rhodanobacteraceae bacterium]